MFFFPDVIGLAVQVQDTKICTTRKGQNVNVTEVTLRDTSEVNYNYYKITIV